MVWLSLKIQIVAAEKYRRSKVSERYSICCCDVERKKNVVKNDAIETVKPIEINTKEPPKKSGRNECRNERFLFKQVATRG